MSGVRDTKAEDVMPQVVLIMGVSGIGKTTVGRLLADKLGWTFHDADEFHPSTNIEKMRLGVPLTDEDRRPWQQQLRQLIGGWIEEQRTVVLACSALTRLYREVLLEGVEDRVRLVYLKGNIDLLTRRLSVREDHFMRQDLVGSQLDILEVPDRALVIDVDESPDRIVDEIRSELGYKAANSRS